MRKIIIPIMFAAVIFIAVLAACSGYLNNQNSADIKGTEFLALADGSGYLSSDNYNEITPFVYHDGGKAWLFFASDRSGGSGGYDIYYAGMDADGKFSKPVIMDTNINTVSKETSPVVYKWYISGATNTYISFIRTQGNSTNLITYKLNSSLQTVSAFPEQTLNSVNAVHVGFLDTGNIFNNLLLISDGTTVLREYINNGTSSVLWVLASSVTNSSPVQSANGYKISVSLVQFFISGSGSLQLAGFAVDQNKNIINLNTADYSSGFKDIQPFIDINGSNKIYFASDRYGKGNFDLYRYNNKTYDKITAGIGQGLDAPVLDLGNIGNWSNVNATLNWSTVFGADGYEVYRYEGSVLPSGPGDYTLWTNTVATNIIDTTVFYYNGQLWYMIVATNAAQRSGFSKPQGNLHIYY